MPNPADAAPSSDSSKPERVEESILEMLHAFDPATALHELNLLTEAPEPLPSVPPAGYQAAPGE